MLKAIDGVSDVQLTETDMVRGELLRRMRRPQRHRLLHGYPLAAAMPRIAEGRSRDALLPDFDPTRGLLVGVLPHPFCNPTVSGCGFCTFAHEAFTSQKAATVIEHVVREIEQTLLVHPSLARRPVSGLYFGGGTANLSPPEPFRALCRALAQAFDLAGAEVTLEGVPAAFLNRRPWLTEILREELPARHFRLSMGIQSFDPDRLKQMGRRGFGDADTFREVVEFGHARGFTVSGDLLFNLPGQSLDAMKDDMRRAAGIGLDHMGLYHLVLFAGLGTAWSRDPALVASLPENGIAVGNWLELRGLLHGLGFRQTTLTNFEREEFRDHERRFVYEALSFQPDQYDMLGFGPTGISFVDSHVSAVKVLNPDAASEYVAAVDRGGRTWDRAFSYELDDLRVFYLTRRLAALHIDRLDYVFYLGSDPLDDFPREFALFEEQGLVRVTPESIEPTPFGMFYSDSMAGLLASSAQRKRSSGADLAEFSLERRNDNRYGHM